MNLSFREAWSRLEPRKRTDRAKILIALYTSDATPGGRWISASALVNIVRLQAPGLVPKNTSDILRKCAADVNVAKNDGQLEWQLTNSGVEQLASWGIAAHSVVSAALEKRRYDIAILCVLPKPELSAVFAGFGGKSAWSTVQGSNLPRVCYSVQMPVMSGETISIVSSLTTTMGLTGSAIAATQLISEFNPRLLLMIGIAAGTRATGRDFGDILVPDPSVDYASGKIVERSGTKVLEPDPYPIVLNPRIKSLLQQYQDSESPFDEIRAAWSHIAPSSAPRIHIGPVGAADQVVDADSVIREIKTNWRKLIGVEMETYGLYRAAHESLSRPLAVAFKSVCDFGAAKTDDYQPYAAYTAANFARYFVSRHWSDIWDIGQTS